MPRPKDNCKGCRDCYNGILTVLIKSPIIAGIMMGIPSYFLLSCILFDGTTFLYPELYSIKSTITGPFYTLTGFTILSWLVELVGIKMMLPNLLILCAFGHSAVGSWWLVNFVILLFAGWSYLPVRFMFIYMITILIPAIIWHITADIIRKYKEKLIEQINRETQALSQQEIAFSTEVDVNTTPISSSTYQQV